MSPSREPLGSLEWEILQYIADHHPISVREVAEHFAETSGQARTTILTVMERLRGKGYLSRRKAEGLHRYRPTVGKSELMQQLVGDFVDNVLGGTVSPFVAYLTQSSLLNEDESRRLTQLLKRLESREQEDEA
jgi:predicted transcriptional regulator